MEGMCNDRRITLRMEIDESLKDVMLDAALFEQVLVNIIKNAAESIETDGETGNRTYLYSRSTDASWMYILFANLCRRTDPIPYYFPLIVSNKNISSVK